MSEPTFFNLSVSFEIVSFRDDFFWERKDNRVGTRSTASPFSEPIRDAVERVLTGVGLRLCQALPPLSCIASLQLADPSGLQPLNSIAQ